MLDTERTFKTKQGQVGQFSKFCLRQQLFAFKEVIHGKGIIQYLQNYKRHEVDQRHSKKFS